MTDKPGGGDGGNNDRPPKPQRPDPFAPLPLADLPPVRRRGPPDPAEEAAATRARRTASERPAEPTAARPSDARVAAAESDVPVTGVEPQEASGSLSWSDMHVPKVSGDSVSGDSVSGDSVSGDSVSGDSLSGNSATGAAAEAARSTDLREADAADDAPLVPSTYNENDLRAAVGATQIPESMPGSAAKKSRRRAATQDADDNNDGGGPSRPRNRKLMLIGALTLAVGGVIATMVIMGKINSQRYLITCEADRVVVEHGRTFPPWGETALRGAEWKALTIPPEAACASYETENRSELAAHYLNILKTQATTLLTAREVIKIDDAEAQLKQALLVARALPREDERIDARDEIERLLGDVGYWRASAKLRTASEALTEAANEFDVAAKQRPRHVTDAAAWALYVRRLVEQLRTGPAGAAQGAFPPLPSGERPSVPAGVALPVEPGDGPSSAGSAADPEPPAAADAGLPTGGVLL